MFWANISMVLPFAFQGLQNGIGSWFRANNVNDSTNGHSWCGYPYQDSSPVFAPDILLMGNGSSPVYPNPNWATTAKQYCGLEVDNSINIRLKFTTLLLDRRFFYISAMPSTISGYTALAQLIL